MRRTNLALLAGIAFALLVSSCAHKSSSENTSPAAAEIQRLIEQRFRANSNADRNYYERLLRPDFLYMRAAPLPISTKQQYLDGEFAGGSDLPRATGTVTDLRIFVDHDTAVASYVSTESTTIGTQKFDNVSNRMDTYVFKDGRWQILSMAASHRPAWPQPVEVPDHVLASYTGAYQLAPGVLNVVSLENGSLFVQSAGQRKVQLFPETAHIFFDKSDDPAARTEFVKSPPGNKIRQIYRAQSQEIIAEKID
ncbi:MAG TPA: DUF4440 domain-containing protein [Candidatus Saccharimonadales bacterium]|nr:DUF4440 domain-containing protein [Candidatus Saccharimonadales bacterium]